MKYLTNILTLVIAAATFSTAVSVPAQEPNFQRPYITSLVSWEFYANKNGVQEHGIQVKFEYGDGTRFSYEDRWSSNVPPNQFQYTNNPSALVRLDNYRDINSFTLELKQEGRGQGGYEKEKFWYAELQPENFFSEVSTGARAAQLAQTPMPMDPRDAM